MLSYFKPVTLVARRGHEIPGNVSPIDAQMSLLQTKVLCTHSNPDPISISSGGSTGAMIPYIERAYNINYAHVSILFVSTFVGYALAAAAAGPLSRRVGFGHALCISIIVELMGVCFLVAFKKWIFYN